MNLISFFRFPAKKPHRRQFSLHPQC
jgi:hypothetical protein